MVTLLCNFIYITWDTYKFESAIDIYWNYRKKKLNTTVEGIKYTINTTFSKMPKTYRLSFCSISWDSKL